MRVGGHGPSGGTLDTMLEIISSSVRDRKTLATARDPYCLNPEPSRTNCNKAGRKEDHDVLSFAYDRVVKAWTAPFLLAGGNSRVARRSSGLFAQESRPYATVFTYRECAKTSGFIQALLTWLTMTIGVLFLALPGVRTIAQKIRPPGSATGSPEQLSKNFFKTTLVAAASTDPNTSAFVAPTSFSSSSSVSPVKEGAPVVTITITGGDPYVESARFVVEAALAIVSQRDELHAGGVLTPAVAFGDVLVNRMKKVGMAFDQS